MFANLNFNPDFQMSQYQMAITIGAILIGVLYGTVKVVGLTKRGVYAFVGMFRKDPPKVYNLVYWRLVNPDNLKTPHTPLAKFIFLLDNGEHALEVAEGKIEDWYCDVRTGEYVSDPLNVCCTNFAEMVRNGGLDYLCSNPTQAGIRKTVKHCQERLPPDSMPEKDWGPNGKLSKCSSVNAGY